MKYVSARIIKQLYPGRPAWSRKGDYGYVLVVGGSERYSGAPALAALGALRAGADIVTVAAPARAADVIAAAKPDFITVPLRGRFVSTVHVRTLLELEKKHDSVVIGNGIGKKSDAAIAQFLKKTKKPCVVDADAIRVVKHLNGRFVITPHAGEFKLLTGKDVPLSLKRRTDSVKKEAARRSAVILLKGHIDIVSDGLRVALNRTGNPYMTKGGTGDVLAGVCGALLAQKNSLFESACGAAFITGRAGDILHSKRHSVLASEIADAIEKVI